MVSFNRDSMCATHLLKLQELFVSLKPSPSAVELVIGGRQRVEQRLLLRDLGRQSRILLCQQCCIEPGQLTDLKLDLYP